MNAKSYEQVQTNEPIFDLEDINISNPTENTSIPQESISNSTKITL